MRHSPRLAAGLALSATLACAAPASASYPHVVAPGETLWSIAASHNLTTRALAAANGLAADAHVVLGRALRIPTVPEAAAALARLAPVAPASSGVPAPMGAYVVRPGDTLSALAARSGVSVARVAWMNGLDPRRLLLVGTPLKLPTGSPIAAPAHAPSTVPRATAIPRVAPYPTPVRLSAAQVRDVAARAGVPASLVAAVAWQESGFNNAMVSAANARGIMQILPGTWDWIQSNLAANLLDPASAADNVRAGALYLGRLLSQSGGDPARAVAGYYQGAASVARVGLLPGTARYVADVLALRPRFGGP